MQNATYKLRYATSRARALVVRHIQSKTNGPTDSEAHAQHHLPRTSRVAMTAETKLLSRTGRRCLRNYVHTYNIYIYLLVAYYSHGAVSKNAFYLSVRREHCLAWYPLRRYDGSAPSRGKTYYTDQRPEFEGALLCSPLLSFPCPAPSSTQNGLTFVPAVPCASCDPPVA